MTDTAIEAAGLGMRYGRRKGNVLADCSFRLPRGRICALVGPNGAGKSTLLGIATGLLRPTAGTVTVLGLAPTAARSRVAYVAQDKPLHPHLTVAATLRLGAEFNRHGRWDQEAAERIAYGAGGVEPTARVRSLSGGQRTRVALALAFGKRPDLLLLDEPMADLDPLARHQLTGALMAEALENGTTIVMSSHVVAELEGSCDYLLLLQDGQIRLGGESEDLLTAHALLTGTAADFAPHTVIERRAVGRGHTALVRPEGPTDPAWQRAQPTLEELILAHLRSPDAPVLLTPAATATAAGADRQEAAV